MNPMSPVRCGQLYAERYRAGDYEFLQVQTSLLKELHVRKTLKGLRNVARRAPQ